MLYTLNMQPIRTIWTILVGDHPGIIPVEFGQIPISGSREEVIWSFPYINLCKIVTHGAGSILTPGGIIWTTLVEDLYMMLYTKYESSVHSSFRQEDFWKLHFENLFFIPWPTYATNWNNLINFDRGPHRDHSCEVLSKSNKRFQRRRCLSKKLSLRTTHDDGQRTSQFGTKGAINVASGITPGYPRMVCRIHMYNKVAAKTKILYMCLFRLTRVYFGSIFGPNIIRFICLIIDKNVSRLLRIDARISEQNVDT